MHCNFAPFALGIINNIKGLMTANKIRNKTANIYTEWLPLIDSLKPEIAGEIFKNILRYQNGEDIIYNNPIWIFIKNKLDEYNDSENNRSKINSRNAKMRWDKKRANECERMQSNANVCNGNIKEKKIKENKRKEKKKTFELNFIENQDFKNLVLEWLGYKKREFGFSYKSEKTIKVFFDELMTLSNGDLELAKKIVGKSISSRYKGIFKSKDGFAKKQTRLEKNIDVIKNCNLRG